MARPGRPTEVFEGTVEGTVAFQPAGGQGLSLIHILLETGKTLRLQTLAPILRLRCRRRFESFQMPMMLLQAQRSDEPDRWVTLVSAHNSGRSIDEMNRLIDQILNENPAIQWVEDEQNV